MENSILSKISVIMAAYNSEKTIGKSIESVIEQTYKNWELIIVNDCSMDNTESVVNHYRHDSRIIYIKNNVNMGVSCTRERALKEAKGSLIAILDSDDLWTEKKLEKQLEIIQSENVDLVYTASSFVDESGNEIQWILHVPRKISYKKLLKQNLISNSSVLVKKDLYAKYYTKGDEMHEDFACWIRMAKAKHHMVGIDEAMLKYRISHSSKSGRKAHAARMNWNTYRYCGLSIISSFYNMFWYTINGIRKYRHIHLAMNNGFHERRYHG